MRFYFYVWETIYNVHCILGRYSNVLGAAHEIVVYLLIYCILNICIILAYLQHKYIFISYKISKYIMYISTYTVHRTLTHRLLIN